MAILTGLVKLIQEQITRKIMYVKRAPGRLLGISVSKHYVSTLARLFGKVLAFHLSTVAHTLLYSSKTNSQPSNIKEVVKVMSGREE